MTSKAAVTEFLAQDALALVGVSRSGKKFGNMLYRGLKAQGRRIFAVHPQAAEVQGDRCYPSLAALPEPVGGVIVVVPPDRTEGVVREAAAAGIKRVWMQQGAESPEAIRFCQEHGMAVVAGECVFMFAQPAGFPHRMHHWLRGLFGKLPG